MSDTTTNRGYTKPAITDNILDLLDVATGFDEIDADVQALYVKDTSHSTYLTPTGGSDAASPDKRLAQSATTDILTVSFTLTEAQTILIGAKALLVNTGSATGALGLCVSIDGARVTGYGEVGAVELGAAGTSTDQINVTIPTFAVSLAAGSHTIVLQADRDANGIINARSTTTPNGRTYHPTSLTVIV